MRPGCASRFHGELSPLKASGREEGALPHLDVLWHYDCVVSPRSPSLSPTSLFAKLHAGTVSPRSPLHASGLLSPPSPASPSSPAASAVREGVFAATSSIPCFQDATHAHATSCDKIDVTLACHQHRSALQRVFSTFDEDGDGRVSIGELCAIFDKLGIPKSQESIESLLSSLPSCRVSNYIDLEGFFILYDSVCAYVDELDSDVASTLGDTDADVDQDLRAAFHVFDLDGNGFISPQELQTVLCALGFVQARQLQACVDMIARVDENGDGHVDFSEFKKLMGLATPALILSC